MGRLEYAQCILIATLPCKSGMVKWNVVSLQRSIQKVHTGAGDILYKGLLVLLTVTVSFHSNVAPSLRISYVSTLIFVFVTINPDDFDLQHISS